jgi:hypothetical protein
VGAFSKEPGFHVYPCNTKNDQKTAKMKAKTSKKTKISQKWSKSVKIGQNRSKIGQNWSKSAKNGTKWDQKVNQKVSQIGETTWFSVRGGVICKSVHRSLLAVFF